MDIHYLYENQYYEPMAMSALNQEIMRRMDEQYTRTPFYGVQKMTE